MIEAASKVKICKLKAVMQPDRLSKTDISERIHTCLNVGRCDIKNYF
jgi:hypothetical protein